MRLNRIIAVSLLAAMTGAWGQTVSPSPTPTPAPLVTARARFCVEVDTQPPALLSTIEINLPISNWPDLTVQAYTDGGSPVGCDVLDSAPNSPTTYVFDSSSGSKRYNIFIGPNGLPIHLPDAKAGVWLETRQGDGQPVDNLTQMLQKWNQSPSIAGRSILNGIFEGGNRHGAQENLLLHFNGWFDVAQPERLALMTVSTDASFLLLDGREITEWPGHHYFDGGLQGQHQGQFDLQPGIHSLEVYNAYTSKDDQWPVLCCAAVKSDKGTFTQWTMLTPDSHFFKPVTQAHLVEYEPGPNGFPPSAANPVAPCAFQYSVTQQSVLSPDDSSTGLITLNFVAFSTAVGSAGSYTWTFDDGSVATGPNVNHTFLRPGNRTVQVDAKDATGKPLGAFRQVIRVHPDWIRLSHEEPHLEPDQTRIVLATDFTKLSTSDLAGAVDVFATFDAIEALTTVIPIITPKTQDVPPADLQYLQAAAFELNDTTTLHENIAIQLLKALVNRCSVPNSQPQVSQLASQCRLLLAKLTIPSSDKLDEIKSLIDPIDSRNFSQDENRDLAIIRADLALARGNVAEAHKQYVALDTTPYQGDDRSNVRQTGKIEQARAFMARGDLESAEHALDRILSWAPSAKLNPNWALTRLDLYRKQNQPLKAYLWAQRLLPVITDSDNRSQLLYELAELALAQNDPSVALKAIQELKTKHPYSEEWARARAKWPDKTN